MFAKVVLTDEERAVDPHLGYPRGYAKLCRHAYIQMQGLITPFTEGPPQRFHPYPPQEEEIAKLKGYDDLFRILDEEDRDASNPKRHIDFLWQQLDHMGNAGFDPAKFRIDIYGNVLYWDADPGSPLAWEVDHWFPHSRGGKTVLSNLRLVQWQVSQRKRKKLEFLVPWWDLQLGVSVNQFLSVFASKNADFRQRAFSLFFLAGENEQLDDKQAVESHSWPHHFRERKNQVGLAAAALVRVHKDLDGALKSLNTNRVAKQQYFTGAPVGNRWAMEEEEAVRRDLQNFGPGHWKDIKDKRWRRGDWKLDKENKALPTDRYFTTAETIKTEQKWKQSLEEDKKQKVEESVQLEEELQKMKAQNVKEKCVLDQLEQALAKQKKRVEKQRRWSETQSQYRLCLEKMIRDTLHQCVVYKEQARLNQAACNALLARLESQKSTCDAAEMDLVRKVKQREDLEALVRPRITKRIRHQGHTDVGSCIKPDVAMEFNPSRNTTGGLQKVLHLYEGEDSSDHNEHNFRGSKVHIDSKTSKQNPNEIEGKEGTADQVVLGAQELRLTGPKLPTIREKYSTKAHDWQLEVSEVIREKFSTKAQGSEAPISEQQCKEQNAEENKREAKQQATKLDSKSDKMMVSPGYSGIKRKALEVSGELDVVLLGYEYGEQGDKEVQREESVGDNGTTQNSNLGCHDDDSADDDCDNNVSGVDAEADADADDVDDGLKEMKKPDVRQEGTCNVVKTRDDEELDELLQEVLVMQDKVNAAMVEAIREEADEEQRVKKVGKLNLDKWLQKLLLDSGYGQNEEPISVLSLQNCPHGGNHGLEAKRKINSCLNATDSGFERVMVVETCNSHFETSAEMELRNRPTGQSGGSELVEVPRGGIIGGLLKKFSFKNAGAPSSEEAGEPNLGVKKPEERRISPWRWVGASPAAKRSASAGSETRRRRLSPWRRNSTKDEKAEERKVMESFSKLKIGRDKRQADVASSSPPRKDEPRRHSMAASQRAPPSPQLRPLQHRQTSTSIVKLSERSTSTPPAHHSRQITASRLAADNDRPAKQRPSTKQAHRRKDDSGLTAAPTADSGGAARKASMLKKSASTRGGRLGGGVGGSSPARSSSSRGGGGGRGDEESLRRKASLFEDLDLHSSNDGLLRSSLSLAWKKAVQKFELGRPPAHLEQ